MLLLETSSWRHSRAVYSPRNVTEAEWACGDALPGPRAPIDFILKVWQVAHGVPPLERCPTDIVNVLNLVFKCNVKCWLLGCARFPKFCANPSAPWLMFSWYYNGSVHTYSIQNIQNSHNLAHPLVKRSKHLSISSIFIKDSFALCFQKKPHWSKIFYV